jgi:hypothetical protein
MGGARGGYFAIRRVKEPMTRKSSSKRNKWQQDSMALVLTINNLLLTINKLLQFATKPVLFDLRIAAGISESSAQEWGGSYA